MTLPQRTLRPSPAAAQIDRPEAGVEAHPGGGRPDPDHLGGIDTRRVDAVTTGIRHEAHRTEREHHAHRHTHGRPGTAHLENLLGEQRRRRSLRAVLAGERDAALRECDEDPCRHVVDVDVAVVGWKCAAPGGIHRPARVDLGARFGPGEKRGPQRLGGHAGVGRSHGSADDASGEHLETGACPHTEQSVAAAAQPHHGSLVETRGPGQECGEVDAVVGVGERQEALCASDPVVGHVGLVPRQLRCHRQFRCH